MHRTTSREKCSPEERLILARFATRVRWAVRPDAETLNHGAFVAL
jgi:hypothetical protein